jgi:hemerythrin
VFKNDFEKGKFTLSLDILNFLGDWWIKHIKETDKKYSVFFVQKGLK